ncbi:class II aldolase/adducin family protein [Streptomyces sp. BE230]|uniref:class II aldolase/adducin family protein n=1 Tax=Streptomyces sp. BE230 TaxID=3002526 RepID=UPI002ECFB191|nr:class II aldolase/adducin family protein [Streptomyces sp. BE230]
MKPVRVHEEVERHRELVLLACRSLDRSDPPRQASGCVSMRSGEAVVISTGEADGPSPRTDRNAVLIDPEEGLPLLGELSWPPPETPAHLAIHRQLPGGGVVIHTREPTTVALAEAVGAAPSTGAAVLTVAPGRRSTSEPEDMADLEKLIDLSGPVAAVLLAGSAVFTWGRSPEEALSGLERIRELGRALRSAPAGLKEAEGKTW